MAGFCGAGGGGDVATDTLWAATGDLAVATGDDTATVLTIGGSSAVLNIECGTPAWTTTPSLTGLTATGDITTTGAAIDWDLKDDCTSALSFDSGCQTGILALVTTNCSEGVTMSGTLGVTGVLTATGGIELCHASQNTLSASSGLLSIESKVVYSACGTDVPVADGGTGLSCLTTGSVLIGTGSSDVTLVAMVTKGHLLGGDGSGAPRALAVGSNCTVLTACSDEDTGMKWAAAASPTFIGVRVENSAHQCISYNSSQAIVFDAGVTQFDTDTMHSACASSKITFTTAGKYWVGISYAWNGATGGKRNVSVRKCGSPILHRQTMSPAANDELHNGITFIYDFCAGDYIEFIAHQTTNVGGGLLMLADNESSTVAMAYKIC